MRTTAFLTVLVLLLSGCSDDGDTDPAPDPGVDADGPTQNTTLDAPTWQVGDWWTYDLSGVGELDWVVSEDAGSTWTVDVSDPGLAFHHAAMSAVSTIGQIHKEHLDGEEGTDEAVNVVHFFDFPLKEGKSWELTWGVPLTATVTGIDEGVATVEASNDDGHLRTYTFDAEAGWFGEMLATDPNGTELFSAQLQDNGAGYDGEYVRWTLHDSYRREVGPGQGTTTVLAVPEEADDIWYMFHAFCSPEGLEMDQGTWHFRAAPPDDATGGFASDEVCPTTAFDSGTLEATPGEWNIVTQSTGGRMFIDFIPRTLETFTVADAGGM